MVHAQEQGHSRPEAAQHHSGVTLGISYTVTMRISRIEKGGCALESLIPTLAILWRAQEPLCRAILMADLFQRRGSWISMEKGSRCRAWGSQAPLPEPLLRAVMRDLVPSLAATAHGKLCGDPAPGGVQLAPEAPSALCLAQLDSRLQRESFSAKRISVQAAWAQGVTLLSSGDGEGTAEISPRPQAQLPLEEVSQDKQLGLHVTVSGPGCMFEMKNVAKPLASPG